MELSVNTIFSIIIPFEATLFTIYLLSIQVERKISNVFIALFIFDFGLENFMPILYENVFTIYPQYAGILDTLFFLQLPLIYLYIKSASFKDFRLSKIDLVHLIPFVLINIITVFSYHILPFESKKAILDGGMRELQGVMYVMFAFLGIQMIIYFVLSFKEINKYRQIVNENYSDLGKYNYRWIRQLLYIFVFILAMTVIKNFAWSFIMVELHNTVFLFLKVLVLIFINWVIYIALKRPYLFSGVDSQIELLKEFIKEREVLNKTIDRDQLSNHEIELQRKLEQCMHDKKPYLHPELTLHNLAAQIDVPTRELSIFINKFYRVHYFDFINSYRIDDAIEILADPANKKVTVLEIMFEVGFNSKSSFNTAFKKHTGFTPTSYRKKYYKSVG